MGTTGPGRISDYPESNSGSSATDQNNNEGEGNQQRCDRAIGDIQLEEVGTLEYFKIKGDLPDIDTLVHLDSNLDDGRLVVLCGGLKLGYIPTKHNYLVTCIADDYQYEGFVTDSTTTPQPYVKIDLAPKDS